MRVKMFSGICCLALMLVSGVTLAQTNGIDASGAAQVPAPKPPNFPLLFPFPTNNNGYEEWVQAADLIQNNPKVESLSSDSEMPLAMKRRLLADPGVERALQLLRAGLQKPVFSPRTSVDVNTTFPELRAFVPLARLLCVEQYVAFADGRVDKAIETLRTGLTFGYRIQTDSMRSASIGILTDTLLLTQFSQHLDQLSVYHCEEVRRIVEDFLGAENPTVHLMALQKSYLLQLLESKRSDPNGFLADLKTMIGENADTSGSSVASLHTYLQSHPGDVNAVLNDAQQRVNALYNQTLLNLRLPVGQRKPLVIGKDKAPGAVLFQAVTLDPQRILDRDSRSQVQLRLLGVHVLIHHYRWDHNTLPGSLAELRADNLVKDSFSGIQIVYTRDGDHYTLTVQGPEKQ
ncbi:MAG: hypothetical protein JWN14_3485 [Chthonomonadales bacterium]|nr:hypothetical protein [Chthonomonadales bacterium]